MNCSPRNFRSSKFVSLLIATGIALFLRGITPVYANPTGSSALEKNTFKDLSILGSPDASLGSTSGGTIANPCAGLLRECVTLSADRRASCFQTAARDERCEKTELSRLAFLRSTLSADQGGEDFALLGPQFVDQECVERFDNQLSGSLIRGAVSDEAARGLSRQLEQCRTESPDDVFRP